MQDQRLTRAYGYPYAAPRGSYRYADGTAQPWLKLQNAERTPVLAFGSNRAPGQLARKFGPMPVDGPIPVSSAVLTGFDAVYSGHLTRYGSVPARLWPSAGTRISVHITWLTPLQLVVMTGTEGADNYDLVRFLPGAVHCREHGPLAGVLAYGGRRPPLDFGAGPVALAEIRADGRRLVDADQAAVLSALRDKLAPELPLDRFVLQNIACPVTRRQRTERLHKTEQQRRLSP